LEVELDGCALEFSLQGVLDCYVDLRTVEGAIARVELPLRAAFGYKSVKSFGELGLGLVPGSNVTQMTLRAC